MSRHNAAELPRWPELPTIGRYRDLAITTVLAGTPLAGLSPVAPYLAGTIRAIGGWFMSQTQAPRMTVDRKRRVSLEAGRDLEIDPGLVLPKGIYPAIQTQLPVSAFSGLTAWTAPEYSLVLNEEQIAEMGGDPTSHGITEEFDVTDFVLTHRLKLV